MGSSCELCEAWRSETPEDEEKDDCEQNDYYYADSNLLSGISVAPNNIRASGNSHDDCLLFAILAAIVVG